MFKKYNYDRLNFDEYNIEFLGVLYRKLSKDYLKFFGQMTKLYKRGDNKKKSLETIEKINRTLVFLSHVINGGILTKKEISDVFVLIDEINASRDYFISESSGNVALRERMDKISKETGINAKDLNLTQEHIRSGIKQTQKSRREGVSKFMKRTAPGTLGLGKNILGGLGTSLTGPFAPILGMAGTALKDIWNVGKGIGGKIREHRERAVGSQLKPASFGAEHTGFGGEDFSGGFGNRNLGYRRSYGKRKSRYKHSLFSRLPFRKPTLRGTVDLTDSLELFYDKKAYKAKWTKELLQRIKDISKGKSKDGGGLGSLLGLSSNFKLLGASILPLLGKTGLFAALAVADIWAAGRIKEFGETVLEYTDVIKKARESIKKQWDLQLKSIEKGQMSAAEIMQDPTKSPKERAAARVSMKVSEKENEKIIKEKATEWADLPHTEGIPKLVSWFWSGMKVIGQEIKNTDWRGRPLKPPSGGTGGTSSGTIPERMENTKLINSLDKLSQQLEKNRSASPVRGPSIGNSFDAADPLLSNFAAGKLTLGGE